MPAVKQLHIGVVSALVMVGLVVVVILASCASTRWGADAVPVTHIDADSYFSAGIAVWHHGQYQTAHNYMQQGMQDVHQPPLEWYYWYVRSLIKVHEPDSGRQILHSYLQHNASTDSSVQLVKSWLRHYPHLPSEPPTLPQLPNASSSDTTQLSPPEIAGGYAKVRQHLYYPQSLIQQGIEGNVQIQARITPSGTVDSLFVFEGMDVPLLNQSAKNAIAQTQFIPAKQNGEPITTWIRIPIYFRIRRY